MKRLIILSGSLLAILVCASVAFAAGGGENASFLEIPFNNWIFRIINFVIFAAIIWKFAGKKIADALAARTAGIKNDLDDLASRQTEAEEKLRGVEQSIANLEEEKAAILAEAKEQGEAMRKAIIEKARVDAEKLTTQAKVTAENEAKAALIAMRAEMADLVVDAAEKIVKEKLSDADHEKLVDDYLTKVVLN